MVRVPPVLEQLKRDLYKFTITRVLLVWKCVSQSLFCRYSSDVRYRVNSEPSDSPQEEVTNFEVKIRVDDHDVALRPGLSCTADVETNMVKDAVAVPMQSVTIRTGDSNLSPEEIEKQKQKVAARDKDDNKAELSNDRMEKQAQREEHEKLVKVVFVKNGSKAQMTKVTTGIADDSYMEIRSGIKPGDEVISGSYSAISRKLKDGAKIAYDKEAMK